MIRKYCPQEPDLGFHRHLAYGIFHDFLEFYHWELVGLRFVDSRNVAAPDLKLTGVNFLEPEFANFFVVPVVKKMLAALVGNFLLENLPVTRVVFVIFHKTLLVFHVTLCSNQADFFGVLQIPHELTALDVVVGLSTTSNLNLIWVPGFEVSNFVTFLFRFSFFGRFLLGFGNLFFFRGNCVFDHFVPKEL